MGQEQQTNFPIRLDSLFELAMQGDRAALNQLFEPCLPQLQRTAARLLSNSYDCEDAIQDGLLSALRHLDKFEGRAQFSTWMHVIVANSAKSLLRKQKRRPITVSLDEPFPEQENLCLADTLPHPQSNQEKEYERSERSQALAALLEELPPTSRSIIWLCDVQGLCMKEAAQWLGLTVSAVKTRHLRANRLVLKIAKERRRSTNGGVDFPETAQPQPWTQLTEGYSEERRRNRRNKREATQSCSQTWNRSRTRRESTSAVATAS